MDFTLLPFKLFLLFGLVGVGVETANKQK